MWKKRKPKNQIGLIQYWWSLVISRTWHEVLEYAKNQLGLAMAILAASIVVSILAVNGILDQVVATGYIDDAGSAVRASVVLVVLSLLYIIWSIIYLPVKIYNEQKKTIVEFERITKSKKVQATKIKIDPGEETLLDNPYNYAYLEVVNGEADDLIDCFAALDVLKIKVEGERDSEDIWGDCLQWVTKNTNRLTWPNFDSTKGEKIVRRGKPERINIAKIKFGGSPIFIFSDGNEQEMTAVSDMYIEVSLNGILKGKPIKEIIFCGFVKYENE